MAEPTAPGDAGPGDADSDLQPRFDVLPAGPGPATVRAAGDIDLTTVPQFQAALTAAAAASGEVTVDMTAVTYCDSAAIHALFTTARDHRLTLVIPEHGPITTMLNIVGLDRITTVITAG
jgi:anti-sigma B factor antagonist